MLVFLKEGVDRLLVCVFLVRFVRNSVYLYVGNMEFFEFKSVFDLRDNIKEW